MVFYFSPTFLVMVLFCFYSIYWIKACVMVFHVSWSFLGKVFFVCNCVHKYLLIFRLWRDTVYTNSI